MKILLLAGAAALVTTTGCATRGDPAATRAALARQADARDTARIAPQPAAMAAADGGAVEPAPTPSTNPCSP